MPVPSWTLAVETVGGDAEDTDVAGLQVEAEGGGHVVAGDGADKGAGVGLTNGLVGGGQFGQARVVVEVQACDHGKPIIGFLCNLRGVLAIRSVARSPG